MAGIWPERGTATFRPKARLIRLIGSELISDEIMAIVELVKNAYDADSRVVTVGFHHLADPDKASLTIQDDGDGMTLDVVLYSWLEPATDRKIQAGKKRRTALGRYPLGEKGVGRFAADKLGNRLDLVTRAREGGPEIALSVHWDRFGETGYLDQVETEWEQRNPQIFCGAMHGTLIRTTALRGEWDSERLERLKDGLSRLVTPGKGTSDFRIVLECADFPHLAGEIKNELVDRAPYHLGGVIDAEGLFHEDAPGAATADLRPLAGDTFVNPDGSWRQPQCGRFRLELFAWDLDVSRPGLPAKVDRTTRAQLRRISGVSLYRDGFRVWPYGAAGDDWLGLNQRRVNNPTLRLSTNQVVGVVEITQEGNPELRDRTSREGLIETPALRDLKALLLAATSRLEERRFAVRQTEVTDGAEESGDDAVLAILRNLRASGGVGRGNLKRLDVAIAEYRRRSDQQAAVIKRLTRLAATGLSVEQIAAEVRYTIGATSTGLALARHRVEQHDVPSDVRTLVEQLDERMEFLNNQMTVVGDLIGEGAGFATDLGSAFQEVASVFRFRQRTGAIRIVLEHQHAIETSLDRRDLLQVLIHLFDNALYWSIQPGGSQPSEIRLKTIDDPVGFVIADNGPGVPKEVQGQVFDLYFSRRTDARGLGLYMVRSILESVSGAVELLREPELLPGANFRVTLPGRVVGHRSNG